MSLTLTAIIEGPNPDSVGSNLPDSPTKILETFDPVNFLKTKTYGQAPANTTLTVKYTYGGGIQDNVPSGDITKITSISYEIDETGLSQATLNTAKQSVAISNPEASSGGLGSETVEELRENIKAYFQAQGRAVTKSDYIIRSLKTPKRSKSHIMIGENTLNNLLQTSKLDDSIEPSF